MEATPGPRSTHDQASHVPPDSSAEPVAPLPARSASPPRQPGVATRRVTPATLVAVVLLVISALTSFTFIVARGGLTLPASPPRAAVAPSVAPSGSADRRSSAPIASVRPSTPAAGPSPSESPAATSRASAPPTPAPSVRPRVPAATPATSNPERTRRSDRYALLSPCPGQRNCWIYAIRPGDNVYSIARFFGHSLETVYRLNPWTRTALLHGGDRLVLPPPTR